MYSTALLDLPTDEAALLFPVSYLVYLSSIVLRYIALDLAVRPDARGRRRDSARSVTTRFRAGLSSPAAAHDGADGDLGRPRSIVAGLLTDDARDFDTFGLTGAIAAVVTAAFTIWLSLVLADAVSGPVIDLRDATRRLAAGDLRRARAGRLHRRDR